MCGICGFYSKRRETIENLTEMNNTMFHRGPNDHGEEIIQVNKDYVIGMAQRRLSVVDLSELGHQPMHSADNRVIVVFNGEIYNYRDLKKELRKEYPFVSSCDTEIILAAYLKWGTGFVQHINGMYAIALYDKMLDTLYLIRDRIGKKPLYYYFQDGNLYFASELKAIISNQYFKKEINISVIGQFLNKQYICAPNSIYRDTFKLEPGCMLTCKYGEISIWKYWDIRQKYHSARQITDFEECKYELKKRLKKAVADRLVADVPVGAFLSGGYDSSLICSIAQEISDNPVKTYSIGYQDEKLDEAPYAKKVAEYLGTDHTEYYISDEEMLNLVDSIPRYYDEPFADNSQIATMLVSEIAKRDVTVVLSGDGGDEFFAGYNIYTTLQKAQKLDFLGNLLYIMRKNKYFDYKFFQRAVPLQYRIISDSRDKNIKTQTGINSYVNILQNMIKDENQIFYFPIESQYMVQQWDIRRMLLDMETYLPEDILCKVDRASMKYSLECRCPFLDKEVMEYSFRIPQKYKDNEGNQKMILKSISYDYLPKELLDRPKKGFGVPIDRWLRNQLKSTLEEFIDLDFLTNQDIFNPHYTQDFVFKYLKNGDQGKDSGANYSKIVWSYFVFQQWYMEYMK